MITPNIWLICKQVLAESEQMRREADDIGPRAELEHWKKRMSKFNYLVDQIKGQEVKAVLGILHTAKSKLIKVCFFLRVFAVLYTLVCLWGIFLVRIKLLSLRKSSCNTVVLCYEGCPFCDAHSPAVCKLYKPHS